MSMAGWLAGCDDEKGSDDRGRRGRRRYRRTDRFLLSGPPLLEDIAYQRVQSGILSELTSDRSPPVNICRAHTRTYACYIV